MQGPEELVNAALKAGFVRCPGGELRRSYSRTGGQRRTRVQLNMAHFHHLGLTTVWVRFLNNAAYAKTLTIDRKVQILYADSIAIAPRRICAVRVYDLAGFEAFLGQLDEI